MLGKVSARDNPVLLRDPNAVQVDEGVWETELELEFDRDLKSAQDLRLRATARTPWNGGELSTHTLTLTPREEVCPDTKEIACSQLGLDQYAVCVNGVSPMTNQGYRVNVGGSRAAEFFNLTFGTASGRVDDDEDGDFLGSLSLRAIPTPGVFGLQHNDAVATDTFSFFDIQFGRDGAFEDGIYYLKQNGLNEAESSVEIERVTSDTVEGRFTIVGQACWVPPAQFQCQPEERVHMEGCFRAAF